jgi:hypothetical protein
VKLAELNRLGPVPFAKRCSGSDCLQPDESPYLDISITHKKSTCGRFIRTETLANCFTEHQHAFDSGLFEF